MKIRLNGESKEVASGITLTELVELEVRCEDNFSCAVNTFFIPRSDYTSYQLQPMDEVDIVMAMQGG